MPVQKKKQVVEEEHLECDLCRITLEKKDVAWEAPDDGHVCPGCFAMFPGTTKDDHLETIYWAFKDTKRFPDMNKGVFSLWGYCIYESRGFEVIKHEVGELHEYVRNIDERDDDRNKHWLHEVFIDGVEQHAKLITGVVFGNPNQTKTG